MSEPTKDEIDALRAGKPKPAIHFKEQRFIVRAICVIDGERYLLYSHHAAKTDEELLAALNDEGLWGAPLAMESVTCMDIEMAVMLAVEEELHGPVN